VAKSREGRHRAVHVLSIWAARDLLPAKARPAHHAGRCCIPSDELQLALAPTTQPTDRLQTRTRMHAHRACASVATAAVVRSACNRLMLVHQVLEPVASKLAADIAADDATPIEPNMVAMERDRHAPMTFQLSGIGGSALRIRLKVRCSRLQKQAPTCFRCQGADVPSSVLRHTCLDETRG
jgi:hypothetical protein